MTELFKPQSASLTALAERVDSIEAIVKNIEVHYSYAIPFLPAEKKKIDDVKETLTQIRNLAILGNEELCRLYKIELDRSLKNIEANLTTSEKEALLKNSSIQLKKQRAESIVEEIDDGKPDPETTVILKFADTANKAVGSGVIPKSKGKTVSDVGTQVKLELSSNESLIRNLSDERFKKPDSFYNECWKPCCDKVSKNPIIIGSSTGMIAGLITFFVINSLVADRIKSNNYSTTPSTVSTQIPNKLYNDIDVYLFLTTYCYNRDMNGCFMIKGKDVYKLDGCSDWYGESFDNQLKCSCFPTSSEELNCDSNDESLKPYCIGKSKDTEGIAPICRNAEISKLDKCTNFPMGDPKFVYYKYVYKSPTSIIADVVSILPVKKSNNIIQVVMSIIIVGAILMIIYLMDKNN